MSTARMKIRMKKNADGRTSLSCTRADGTTTWQTLNGGQARFFPRHDLTHYAVETVLGRRDAFYGLVAAGWDLSDFGTPWPRGRIPGEAMLMEIIVGALDVERGTGELAKAAEISRRLCEACAENSLPYPAELTEDDLARIRRKRAELFAAWEAVRPGDALELPF